MNANIRLTTSRLLIERLTENDADFILELVNTKGWLKFIVDRNVNNKTDALAYIKKINGNQSVKYWTVKLKETNEAIGVITFIKRDYLEHNDIGFAFLPNFANKGYAIEATQKVLNFLVQSNNLTTILATTIPANVSSINLLKKLGLQFYKVIEVESETLYLYKSLTN